ncbi:MAG: glycosyltransferase family 2 protein [Candidatus Omnitrophica bacterium]|nr:glycosyltransferase family 2 protein [Candidatus Omnitrophota bacterium]
MKLIIQIPCYNEEKSLPVTLPLIPKKVAGFDEVEILIVDDGSTDKTVEVARQYGVDHIIRLTSNQGLAAAFRAGISTSLEFGADIIVNIDADNQYNASDIGLLTAPLLAHEADITIGARPIEEIKHFSRLKKFLQKFGSGVVRSISRTNVVDATSGFRGMTKEAALHLNIFSKYSYTLEMIIQATEKQLYIKSVPIRVNPDLRPSRLARNTFSFVINSVKTLLDVLSIYRAFRFLFVLGFCVFILGVVAGSSSFWLAWIGQGKGHTPSLVIFDSLITVGVLIMVGAFLARMLAVNRRIMEEIQYHLRKNNSFKNKLDDLPFSTEILGTKKKITC